MIRNKKGTYNLNELITPYTEYGRSNIFDITMSESLRLGRNEIKLSVDPGVLLKETEIYIDILDSNNNPIYYEISKIANEDLTRSIIVYIYDDTPPGKCSMYISGTVKSGQIYLFNKNIDLTLNEINNQPIKFETVPKILYSERIEPIRSMTSSRNKAIWYSNSKGLLNIESISVRSKVSPKNLDSDILHVEIPELTDSVLRNEITTNIGLTDSQKIPTYFDNSILTNKNFAFTSSMEGGRIYLNQLSFPKPNGATNIALFQSHSFSASIVRVINTSSIEIYPPLIKTIDYLDTSNINQTITYDRIYDHTVFTMSYYENLTMSSSQISQSYVSLDLFDIEPVAGNVESIRVSYKPINVFGNNFQPIGIYQVQETNILTDSSSIFFDNSLGLIENPIGIFRKGLSDFQNYWVTQSFGTGSIVVSNSNLIKEGIRIAFASTMVDAKFASTRSLTEYHLFKPKNSKFANRNTEFKLTFDTFVETDYSRSNGQMDVYISGSEIISKDSNLKKSTSSLRHSSSFGTYIGSITQEYGNLKTTELSFINKNSANILPTFVIQSGVWNFGNIKLSSRSEPGFSPNQSRIYAPLSNIDSPTELALKVEYLNNDGTPAKISTLLDKVYFNGPNRQIKTTLIQYGSSSKQTYLMNYSGQTSALTGLSSGLIIVDFPIFRDSLNQNYTGSTSNVGLTFDINTIIHGYTGSISSSIDTYVWAASTQGRASVNSLDNLGRPFIFTPISISGSAYYTYGTYGPGGSTSPVKANYDSWFLINAVAASSDGILRVRYAVIPTGSQVWTVNCTTICNVTKYEIKY